VYRHVRPILLTFEQRVQGYELRLSLCLGVSQQAWLTLVHPSPVEVREWGASEALVQAGAWKDCGCPALAF
jgi:hypothetical protein